MRDYSGTDTFYRVLIKVDSIDPQGNITHSWDELAGPYTKLGTARGVASHKVRYKRRENEWALAKGDPVPYVITVIVEKAEAKWVAV